MTKLYRLIMAALVAVCLAGCNEVPDIDDVDLDEIFSGETEGTEKVDTDPMQVMKVTFSPNYKNITMQATIVRDLGPYALTDTNEVYIKTIEKIGGIVNDSRSKPVLTAIKNSEAEEVAKLKIKILVIVDLAQPQYIIDEEQNAVREMRTVFARNNLYVSFMYGQNVTETMEASDYVLDTYFKSQSDRYKYLYRAVLLKKREMEDRLGVWADAKELDLVVFSDEVVYAEDDTPIDPQHFELQGTLVNADSLKDKSLSISSVCFRDRRGQLEKDDQAKSVMKVVCKNSDGLYMDQFVWTALKNKVLKKTDGGIISNEFVFENPDGKVYRGNPHSMRVELYSKANDSLIGTASTGIYLGTIYNPVIVNGNSTIWIFIQGIVLGLFILLLVYLVFQFVIPYIQYRLFKKKYVVRFVPGMMSVGKVFVTQSCYFCKAQFVEGEEIVAKCNHVMHKSCWDENMYHCPEYGRQCKDGSHYYNHANLFDTKNASFYLKWLLIAIAASICTWFFYMLYVVTSDTQSPLLSVQTTQAHVGMMGSAAVFNDVSSHIEYVPIFGMMIGFFVTLALSVLTVRRQHLKRRLADIFLRALIVGVGSFLVFLLVQSIVIAFKMELLAPLVSWIPWTLTALMIVWVSTIGTRIRLRKFVLAIAMVLGVLSMYLWSFFDSSLMDLDIRVLVLFSCIIYAVGIAVSVAEMAPKSERYFLNVKGAVKEMDVALFKWFLSDPDYVVTIGKSIDCSLQMSWDLKGKVAPVQAELRMDGGGVRLTALENGVMIGERPLAVGKGYRLYHNSAFSIGDTTFTYVERDI